MVNLRHPAGEGEEEGQNREGKSKRLRWWISVIVMLGELWGLHLMGEIKYCPKCEQ